MDIETFANFMNMVAEAFKFLTKGVNFIAPVFDFFAKIPNTLSGLFGGSGFDLGSIFGGGGGFDLGSIFGGLIGGK